MRLPREVMFLDLQFIRELGSPSFRLSTTKSQFRTQKPYDAMVQE